MSIDKPFKPSKNEKSESHKRKRCLTIEEARNSLSAEYHESREHIKIVRIHNECAKEGGTTVYFKIDGDERVYSALF